MRVKKIKPEHLCYLSVPYSAKSARVMKLNKERLEQQGGMFSPKNRLPAYASERSHLNCHPCSTVGVCGDRREKPSGKEIPFFVTQIRILGLYLQQKPKILLTWNKHVWLCGPINSFTNWLLNFTRFWHNQIWRHKEKECVRYIYFGIRDHPYTRICRDAKYSPVCGRPHFVCRKIWVVLTTGRDEDRPRCAELLPPKTGWHTHQN